MLFVEVWRELVVDHLLIGVEPFYLLALHHVEEDRRGEDRAEGEMLEGVVRTEGESFVALLTFVAEVGWNDEHGVLMAHSVAAGYVDAWLVGDGHAWEERSRHVVHAELVRAFVYVHERAYAVACAVEVVDAVAPHRSAGEGIELCAVGAAWEHGAAEVDESAQHEGVVASLFPSERTERNGTCYVGCSVLVLSS